MTETLTESFCERCGTRYEFEAPARLNPLRRTRGFIGGLRNYLTSQDALSDAMGDAMRSEEAYLASVQLDAFHESFNFCIGCRQYTCVTCWNDAAGRCRTCVPIPGTDDVDAGPADARGMADVARMSSAAEIEGAATMAAPEAWPTVDLATTPERPTEAGGWAEAEGWVEVAHGPLETAPLVEPVPDGDRWPAAQPEPESEPEPLPAPDAAEAQVPAEPEVDIAPDVAADDPEPIPAPFEVTAWETDGAYELRALEPDPAAVEAETTIEPLVAEADPVGEELGQTTELVVEPEPESLEPVEAFNPEPEREAEPAVVEVPPIAPSHETVVHLPLPQPASPPEGEERLAAAPTGAERVPAHVDDAPEVAARRAQLELLGLGDPGEGPLERGMPRPLPYRSRGTTAGAAEMAAVAAARVGGSFWEASAREVAAAPGQIGIQACGQCGLSLSASARFCRRCGTRQAQSA